MGVSEGTFWESIGPGRREGGRAGVKAGEAGGGHSRFVDVDIRRRSVDPEFLVVIHGVYRAVRAAPVLPKWLVPRLLPYFFHRTSLATGRRHFW